MSACRLPVLIYPALFPLIFNTTNAHVGRVAASFSWACAKLPRVASRKAGSRFLWCMGLSLRDKLQFQKRICI